MFPITVNDIILTMAACLFLMGLISIGIGLFILITKVFSGDLKTIANQTAKLAQKGISDDMSGLVGNASVLIEALNQMVKTASGVALFMIIIGFVQMVAAYYLVLQIN